MITEYLKNLEASTVDTAQRFLEMEILLWSKIHKKASERHEQILLGKEDMSIAAMQSEANNYSRAVEIALNRRDYARQTRVKLESDMKKDATFNKQ